MFEPRRISWRLILLGALIASTLGGAYLGFQSGGRSSPHESGKIQDPGQKGGKGRGIKINGSKREAGEDNAAEKDAETDGIETDDMRRRLKKFFSEGDEAALDGLLPMGITQIEGAGGHGLGRQVKSQGKWYPVFDLSHVPGRKPDGSVDEAAAREDTVRRAVVPLSVASPNSPPGHVGQPYSYTLAAVGGTPPYRWAMQGGAGAEGFSLDPGSGVLAGQAAKATTAFLNVFVWDAAGAMASVIYTLVVLPDAPLTITTSTLPVGQVGSFYQALLTGEGGVPPYTWTISVNSQGWQCDPTSGMLTASPTQAEATSVLVTLTDQQHTVTEKSLDLKVVNGLDISTDSPLPPAAPGSSYTMTFDATGGSQPYSWKVASGALPPGWNLTEDGQLTGQADRNEGQYQFIIEVSDNDGQTFRKAFELGVVNALIVVPSRQKAGLAWQYDVLMRAAGSAIQNVSIRRRGPEGEAEVYRGRASNVVDHGLITGATYRYTLTAYTVDARAVPFGSSEVTILPITLQRAVPGSTGDPYADRVRAFNPLSPNGYGATQLPYNVTGPPDGHSTFAPASLQNEVVSLHARQGTIGGSITLEFTDNIVELAPGPDFTVFENVLFRNGDPRLRYMEPAVVEVALFDRPGQWYRFPVSLNKPVDGNVDVRNPSYYALGFAGVNGTTGDDPTNPMRSGGDSFDANALGVSGLTWIRLVRIISTGHKAMRDMNGTVVEHTGENGALSGGGSSGFDLDAVSAVNY